MYFVVGDFAECPGKYELESTISFNIIAALREVLPTPCECSRGEERKYDESKNFFSLFPPLSAVPGAGSRQPSVRQGAVVTAAAPMSGAMRAK